jgi:hypothetical protein
MVIGWEALETAVTDSSTGVPSLKAAKLMASVTAIEGAGAGGVSRVGLYGDIACFCCVEQATPGGC